MAALLSGKAVAGPRVAGPCAGRPSSVACSATQRRVVASPRVARQRQQLATRSADEGSMDAGDQEEAPQADAPSGRGDWGPRGRRQADNTPQFTHFLPLPKPSHLVYIKPTVAVVADVASRSSVGLKMTAGDDMLERYIIEFYSKSVK